ncbi:unnamed protein product, partial [Nesidiocoris tenuis]
MDPEAFLDIANQVTKMKMFPYFDIAHSVLCALHVREDLGAGESFERSTSTPTAGGEFERSALTIISPPEGISSFEGFLLPYQRSRWKFAIVLKSGHPQRQWALLGRKYDQ